LKRGIGIHQGGLLPILKEIVEILFSEGFAIGINMPAKTVVFTKTRKWDGQEIWNVTCGEYIQMSGRAGRRGKDDRGVVIQMVNEKMEPAVCKGMLYGDPDPLNSSYRISYNMLINMVRVEDVDPEYLLRASFHQYQQESEAPALEAKADETEAESNAIEVVLEINVGEFNKLLERASELKKRLSTYQLTTGIDEGGRIKRVRAYEVKCEKMEGARLLRREARACQTLVMKDELRKMKRVLKELGHVDASGVIQTKGRAACEVNTANELVVVELLFAGLFNDLTVEQSVALLSCLIFDDRIKDEEDPAKGLKSYLSGPYYKLIELARSVAKVVISCKIELNEDEFVEKFNPGLMEAVYAWVKGAKFVEVQRLTDQFEGSTIRSLRRLEELVRQLASASKAIGNLELMSKFEKGSDLLKRDIVFCSSLYL